MFGGVALAFLLETLDDSVKSSEDVEKRIDAPILGLVPWVSERQRPKHLDHLGLLVHEDPKSPLAEAYRSFRTSLIFATTQGAPRLLHFTSASATEGKTTSACNTAITLAHSGSTVLLIDCDLRSPSLHTEFGLPNAKGLTHYLTGASDPAEIAVPSQVTRLFVITSGPLPPNPVDLLAGERMSELLESARQRFDYVVLDGPPVLGLADAVVLANLAGATILVVESQATRAGALQAAAKRLRSGGANILGGVLVKHGKAGGGYGYGYDYHYTYAYGGRPSDLARAVGELIGRPPMVPELLVLAVEYQRRPQDFRSLSNPEVPLPASFDALVSGLGGALSASQIEHTAAALGLSPAALRAAALFLVRHVLLAPNADHYRVLGLSPGAHPERVAEHYHLLVRFFHPDRLPPEERQWGGEITARLNAAYATLKDDDTRDQYDRELRARRARGRRGQRHHRRPMHR